MIKKTKRQHNLWTEWKKIRDAKINPQYPKEMLDLQKQIGIKPPLRGLFEQPMAGRWYYEYRNDKGGYVGLAKLQDHNFTFTKGYRRKWMWETCTANEELELRRFPTQKEAEIAIYEFLK